MSADLKADLMKALDAADFGCGIAQLSHTEAAALRAHGVPEIARCLRLLAGESK